MKRFFTGKPKGPTTPANGDSQTADDDAQMACPLNTTEDNASAPQISAPVAQTSESVSAPSASTAGIPVLGAETSARVVETPVATVEGADSSTGDLQAVAEAGRTARTYRIPYRIHDFLSQDDLDTLVTRLGDLDDTSITTFLARIAGWGSDLVTALKELYGAEKGGETARTLIFAAADTYRERNAELRMLDVERSLNPLWHQDQRMIGYAGYTERFAGDLGGVEERIDYLKELGITYLHLMPLLTPRLGDSDGGYAVADYRSVREDLGTMDDLEHLATRLRGEGISLVMDLVLNHVAREHAWAKAARAGDAHYRDYFYIYPDRTQPDEFEKTLPEIFPDFAPGNFTWDDEVGGWVWTTFNAFQWDVNWSNPNVLIEYANIVMFLANKGVEVLRLDAIAFMGKRLGTDCQGQPEVHWITQALRALVRIACPAVVLKAEAIVAPSELVQYLGTGKHAGKVSDLAYHNSLMVQIWSMFAAKNVHLAAHALNNLPQTPKGATWICYLRCHDDIGWAISDEDAWAVGVTGPGHRAFLSDWYSGEFEGSDARGLVFQYNPATGDRRISGTAASLIGIEAATHAIEAAHGDGDMPVDQVTVDAVTFQRELKLRALRTANAILFAWGGIPVLWSGDELGQPNDPQWNLEFGHEDDNRWANRPRLDALAVEQRHDRDTVAGRVFTDLAHLAEVRGRYRSFDASVPAHVGPIDDDGVFATVKPHPAGTLVGIYNVTPSWRSFPFWRLAEFGIDCPWDVLADREVIPGSTGQVSLEPYAALWVLNRV